jgi:hypothetical protein
LHVRLDELDFSIAEHSRRIHGSLASLDPGRRNKAADNRDLRDRAHNLLRDLPASAYKRGFFHKIPWRVSTDGQLGKENHISARTLGLTRTLNDLFFRSNHQQLG